MRKTKIICTIGPACQTEETLTAMCLAGMNVARLNFSHGTHESHLETINLIKKVRDKLNMPIPIMLDTKGPEYRVGTFEGGKAILKAGDTFTLTADDITGNNERVSINFKTLAENLVSGDEILLCDGMMKFEVLRTEGHDVICKVTEGGVLSDRKSMNFPGKLMKHDFLSEQDIDDILFGVENGIDFVAASFVSTGEDAASIRRLLDENGGENIDIIAKIENRSGVENIDDICKYVDGIMVARGDLGVEIPFIEVPSVQKKLTSHCRMLGRRVITATEMLESMIRNPRPTRAEISDVANAVYEGASCVMLSGETASGDHPVESVKVMSEICEYTEKQIDYREWYDHTEYRIRHDLDAISHATCAMANDVGAKCIVVHSITGQTVRMISRFRCPAVILGNTTDERTWRQLAMSWGVLPVKNEIFTSKDEMFADGVRDAIRELNLKKGDKIVLTGGEINGSAGNTDTIKVVTVE